MFDLRIWLKCCCSFNISQICDDMKVRFWVRIDGSLFLENRFEQKRAKSLSILLRRTLLDCFRTPGVRVLPGLRTFISLISTFYINVQNIVRYFALYDV